ncbi:MAG TPA: flagellar basal body rod protein FlgB [Chthonomonadales bacterium]|nr:flagellar basal body rod protein FlgB [Chthonomonadales bacterium]
MLEKILNTKAFLTAQAALDGLSLRHAAISHNIANVNTPGYKRIEVPFESALARAVRKNVSTCGLPCRPNLEFTPPVVRDPSIGRADGNNVDIEREIVQLADNTLRYETLSSYVASFFLGLKAVINSGR